MSEDGPAQRMALWDTWEQVEGRTGAELKEIYRAALRTRGVDVPPEAFLTFMAAAMIGDSWTGDEVRDGARGLRERVATDYRAAREGAEADRPVREEIRRSVAAAAAGKTRAQVHGELIARYSAAGLGPVSQGLAAAEAVKIVKLTWREKLLAVRDFGAFTEAVWGGSQQSPVQTTAQPRHPRPAQPEWSRPPPGSTARARGGTLAVRVELTDDGIEALSQLITEWQPDAPDHQPVCWLTVGEGSADPVVVHLGDRPLGRLDGHASDLCRDRVAAAQAAQQWLKDTALLTGDGTTHAPFLLRVRIPLRRPGDDPD